MVSIAKTLRTPDWEQRRYEIAKDIFVHRMMLPQERRSLTEEGNAEVCGEAKVYGEAEVCGNARVCGNAVIKSKSDYIVFKNWWSSGRYKTRTRSNDMWIVGCFYGTGEELIKKAYNDSEEKGREYERIVKYVESIKQEFK